jgi:Protein of unknown function (DUF2786)
VSSNPERERIIAKINKCLALAKSANPNEAATAMRQAQKLMQLHSVDEGDILGSKVESVQAIFIDAYKKKIPLYIAHLTNLICAAFGIDAVYEGKRHKGSIRLAVRYFGPKGRPEIAAYTHEVIWRQLKRAWKEYSATNPFVYNEVGARTGFWVGWLSEVRSKVIAFGGVEKELAPAGSEAVADDKGMILTAHGKEMEEIRKAIRHYAPDIKESKTNSTTIYDETAEAGADAAKGFQLHHPISGAKQHQLS